MRIAVFVKRWGVLALGIILVVMGFTAAGQPRTFGWFGYASPSEGVLTNLPSELLMIPTGAGIAIGVGIALISGWLGYLLHSSRNG